MKIPAKNIHILKDLIKVARRLHEDAAPLKTLDNPKVYEVSASNIGDLGDILQQIKEEEIKQCLQE